MLQERYYSGNISKLAKKPREELDLGSNEMERGSQNWVLNRTLILWKKKELLKGAKPPQSNSDFMNKI